VNLTIQFGNAIKVRFYEPFSSDFRFKVSANGVARHDNQGGFRRDNLRDLTLLFRTLSGNFQIPDVVASFFRSHAGPSH